MKAETKKEIVVVVTLTESEARLLRDMMQNPLMEGNEPSEYADFRKQLFYALEGDVPKQGGKRR